MPTKTCATKRRRSIGPNIVRAWFDTAVNPVLAGMAVESDILASENWTWRFQPPRLLSLVPVREYLVPEARDNLDQFLSFHPHCQEPIARHDQHVHALLEGCQALHAALARSEELRDAYDRASVEVSLPTGRSVADLFGAWSPQHHLDVLAELIVNGTGQLPSYYGTAPLWNAHRGEFLRVRETESIQPLSEAARQTGENLAQAVRDLAGPLQSARNGLSLDHDVPFAERVPTAR